MRPRVNTTPHHTKVYTAATVYPVTVNEVKDYLRVTDGYDDAMLSDAIKQATAELEGATRRSFVNATYDDVYDGWPIHERDSAVVHRNPLVSVTSIAYIDNNGTTQTWASSNYDVDTTSEPGRIALADNATLPLLDYDYDNTVTIRYVAGYGATADTVPILAKHYIYLWVSAAYCRRPLTDEENRALRSLEVSLSYGL